MANASSEQPPRAITSTSGTSRAWVFTVNNYVETYLTHAESLVTSNLARGVILGKEVGESGTPHLQSFIRFKQPRSFNWVREKLKCPETDSYPHIEKARFASKAVEYCKKEDEYVVFGQVDSCQGKRTDLEDACRDLMEHKDIDKFKDDYPHVFVKYYKGLTHLITPEPRDSSVKPQVIWCTGPTGSGKTRWVWDNHDHDSIWEASIDLKWFDGYNGQPVAVLDDFRGDWCKFSFLLKVLDRYRLRVPVKGGFVPWVPTKIIITCIHPPESVYNVADEPMEQLLRRIDNVMTFPLADDVHTSLLSQLDTNLTQDTDASAS